MYVQVLLIYIYIFFYATRESVIFGENIFLRDRNDVLCPTRDHISKETTTEGIKLDYFFRKDTIYSNYILMYITVSLSLHSCDRAAVSVAERPVRIQVNSPHFVSVHKIPCIRAQIIICSYTYVPTAYEIKPDLFFFPSEISLLPAPS